MTETLSLKFHELRDAKDDTELMLLDRINSRTRALHRQLRSLQKTVSLALLHLEEQGAFGRPLQGSMGTEGGQIDALASELALAQELFEQYRLHRTARAPSPGSTAERPASSEPGRAIPPVTRQPAPRGMKTKLKHYRSGLVSIPPEYISWHEEMARARLDVLVKSMGLAVLEVPKLVNEGWGDGMQVLRVVVHTPSDRRVSLQWHDTSQDFMVECKGGGHASLRPGDLD